MSPNAKNSYPFQYKTEEEVFSAAKHIMEARLLIPDVSFHSTKLSRDYFVMRLGMEEREIFTVAFLNNQHTLIACEDVFLGTIDGAAIYPREVVKIALKYNAAACVFAHNHPNQSLRPSEADKVITERLKNALSLVDVKVLDHIIVAASQTFSFAENGLL